MNNCALLWRFPNFTAFLFFCDLGPWTRRFLPATLLGGPYLVVGNGMSSSHWYFACRSWERKQKHGSRGDLKWWHDKNESVRPIQYIQSSSFITWLNKTTLITQSVWLLLIDQTSENNNTFNTHAEISPLKLTRGFHQQQWCFFCDPKSVDPRSVPILSDQGIILEKMVGEYVCKVYHQKFTLPLKRAIQLP